MAQKKAHIYHSAKMAAMYRQIIRTTKPGDKVAIVSPRETRIVEVLGEVEVVSSVLKKKAKQP